MLSPIQVKARTYLNFKAMGEDWTDEKAKAHADIAPEEWSMVQEEIDKLREPSKDEATRKLEERVAMLEKRLGALEQGVGMKVKPSQPKPRRKQNLSPEERTRRSDHMAFMRAIKQHGPVVAYSNHEGGLWIDYTKGDDLSRAYAIKHQDGSVWDNKQKLWR